MMKQKSWWLRGDLPEEFISLWYILFAIVLLTSCHTEQFQWKTKTKNTREFIIGNDSLLMVTDISRSSKYGYTPSDPVKLGVTKLDVALKYPDKYFNTLVGPNGEPVYYRRIKSCCPFKTVNSEEYPYQNLAVLEVYEISYEGLKEPLLIYVNFFDEGKVLAPKGFSIKSLK